MRLPSLNFQGKYKSQVVTTYGLNLTQDFKDGELRDGYGITSSAFPALTQREKWSKVQFHSGVTDMYHSGGKLFTINDHSEFYVDGDFVADLDRIQERRKFATLNKKIVVFPDKFYYDVETGEYGTLYDDIHVTPSKITSRTITLGNSFVHGAEEEHTLHPAYGLNVLVYAYKNGGVVRDCYDDKNGRWDNYKLGASQIACGATATAFDGSTIGGYPMLKEGDCIIPKRNLAAELDIVTGWYGEDETVLPDITEYVQTTMFGVVKSVEHPTYSYSGTSSANIYAASSASAAVAGRLSNGDSFTVLGGKNISGTTWYAIRHGSVNGYVIYDRNSMTCVSQIDVGEALITVDYYSFSTNDHFLNHKYKQGMTLDITGSRYGLNDAVSATIESINVDDNSMTFVSTDSGGKVFNAPTWYAQRSSGIDPGLYALHDNARGLLTVFIVEYRVSENVILFIDESKTFVYAYSTRDDKVVATFQVNPLLEAAETITCTKWTQSGVTIKRSIPNLDFICSSGNRLWGVSNETKTIHASAWGAPEDFYGNAAQADGAWSVQTASENDFTAVVANGGNIYAFKEDRVIKVIGTNPTEYYTTEYEVAGVQAGSDMSAVSINNVIYYKGVNNVYVFSGYEPTQIGTNLGSDPLSGGIGWSDYKTYYLYLKKPDGSGTIFGLDLRTGAWMPIDRNKAVDGAAVIDNVSYVASGGFIYKQDGAGDSPGLVPPDDEWMAEYCPFKDGTTQHKGLTKLILYIEVEQGTTYDIEIKQDNGDWVRAFHGYATSRLTQWVPIRIGRCVRYSLRISGKGKAVLHEIRRETSMGSDR